MSEGTVSLCMIVKNEETRLSRCLDSVSSISPEIVIVDTGSTDATLDVASSFGAKVISFDFHDIDFSAARNCGIEHATRPWILILDADETVAPASLSLIQEIICRDENAGYYVRRTNRLAHPGIPTTDYIVRLFRNRPEYRFHGRVHETVDDSILADSGRLFQSSIRLDHDFASSPEARRRKNICYIGILEEELTRKPNDVSRLTFLAAEYHQLGKFDQAMAIVERIADLRPLEPEAHLNVGIYHLYQKRDRAGARADFMKALRLRPSYSAAKSFLQLVDAQAPDH